MDDKRRGTIVFITGAFISHTCWDKWIEYFETEGYKCIAPAWPYKDAPAEELRNRPLIDPIALNTMISVTKHFASIIKALPEKPILIGHSTGGLIVQLLLQRDMGRSGAALHSFPPRGVNRFRLSFLKTVWKAMVLFTSNRKTYLIPFIKWKYTITNRMSCEQQKQSYYQYAIPESKRIIRDIFKCSAKIDFKKPHAPLLLTSGGMDKLIPASMNRKNYKKYDAGNSVTDYKEFEDHTHFIFDNSPWKKEAAFILHWLQNRR